MLLSGHRLPFTVSLLTNTIEEDAQSQVGQLIDAFKKENPGRDK
jgi:hypothetical protein